jgi:DNA-binding CsgD family transcriptional regulator
VTRWQSSTCIRNIQTGRLCNSQNDEESNDTLPLTRREKEILKFLAEGLTAPEIGEKLFVSQLTIESHRRNIMAKLKAKNTAMLIKIAMELLSFSHRFSARLAENVPSLKRSSDNIVSLFMKLHVLRIGIPLLLELTFRTKRNHETPTPFHTFNPLQFFCLRSGMGYQYH